MTEEDKELLLRDLCTRLPYGTKLNIKGYSLARRKNLSDVNQEIVEGIRNNEREYRYK